jgi:hypothetical protein
MERRHPLRTHVWADGDTPRQITQDGKIIFHHRCLRCGRDFVQAIDRARWQAATGGNSAYRASCEQRDRAMGKRGMSWAITARR